MARKYAYPAATVAVAHIQRSVGKFSLRLLFLSHFVFVVVRGEAPFSPSLPLVVCVCVLFASIELLAFFIYTLSSFRNEQQAALLFMFAWPSSNKMVHIKFAFLTRKRYVERMQYHPRRCRDERIQNKWTIEMKHAIVIHCVFSRVGHRCHRPP